jgi:hypothetical protein
VGFLFGVEQNLRPFLMLGQIVKWGSDPRISGLTVAQAAAIAGGYTYRASKRSNTIQQIRAACGRAAPYGRVQNRIRRECA